MTLTEILAVWGAGLSTVLGLLTLWREIRDRPRLKLWFHWEIEWTEEEVSSENWDDSGEVEDVTLARLILDVINEGPTPQTIVEAWLAYVPSPLAAVPFKPDEEFHVIPGHHAKRYTIERFAVPPAVHVDTPIRAYVVDAHGDEWWSEGRPVYRDLLDGHWRPGVRRDQQVAPELTEPLSRTPINRIEPQWKIWKAKHLRR